MASQRSDPLERGILKLNIRHLMDLENQIEKHLFCCNNETRKGLLDFSLVTPTY